MNESKRLSNVVKKSYFLFLLMLFCMISAVRGFAQGITVIGTVSDSNGPLAGVTIIIKGTSTGLTTNGNGGYSITVPNPDAVLQFSYLGYKSREVAVGSKNQIDVTLVEDAEAIGEVVVTAFATQKRVNVTGAIATVAGSDIVSAPVANLSNALVGLAPGLSATQFSGEPGRNSADITIRGSATWGSSTPLFVIDGIEQTNEQAVTMFNSLDPNDILGVSVLKDASSTAVYGIRGANGVIIVTTKRGQTGKPKVSLSTNFGLTIASSFQDGLNSYDWARLRNEAIENEMKGFGDMGLSRYLYSEDDLWKFQNNRDFTDAEIDVMSISPEKKAQLRNSPGLYYFSWDAWPEIFGRVAPQTQTNVNVSGGTERVKYYASIGHFHQKSISQNYKYYGAETGSDYTRYNFRVNLDIEIFRNTTLSANISGQFGTTRGPGTGDPFDLNDRYAKITQYIFETTPFAARPILDGHLIEGYSTPSGSVQDALRAKTGSSKGNQNAIANLLRAGQGKLYNGMLDNTLVLKHEMSYLTKGLSLKATLNYQDNYTRYVTETPSLPVYTVRRGIDDPTRLDFFGGGMSADGFNSWGRDHWNKLYLDAGLFYNNSFGNHNVGALFLGTASKYTMPWSGGFNTPSGIMGFVGRVTSDYAQRYMVEMNMGYNGTEQFAEGRRFGLFPAFSAGWVLSNEPYFPKNKYLTFLKFRGSYGEVGNDLMGSRRYLYLPNTYNLNQGGYWLGNSTGNTSNPLYRGAAEGSLGNANITWERSRKMDIGMEARFLNDRLSLVVDYFTEKRNNILTTLGIIPCTYGVEGNMVPPANVGRTSNRGYEIKLGWNDQVNEHFGYYIEGSISYARSKIEYKAEAENPYYWMNETGFSIGQRFGLKSDGFFDTEEELNSRPYNTYTSNRATLGDIKYLDLNGDGLLNEKDYAPIGYPNSPEYQFAFKLGFNYKGFYMNALITGTAHGSFYLTGHTRIPYNQTAGNAFQWQADGRWTPERAASGAKMWYPRFAFNATDGSHHNYLPSDFWMYSSAHLKLKNLEIGYTFPKTAHFMETIGISSLSIYANANNVWTIFDRFPSKKMGLDPEARDNSTYRYPLTRTFNIGINLQF